MQTYIVKSGQSMYDVCLQVYGDMNLIFKLIKDNALGNIGADIAPGKRIIFDETLIKNFSIASGNSAQNIIYVTGRPGPAPLSPYVLATDNLINLTDDDGNQLIPD